MPEIVTPGLALVPAAASPGAQWSGHARTTGPTFLDAAVVADDASLWIAWEGAQDAWLASKRRRSGGDNTVRAYSTAVKQFFAYSATAPWRVSPAHAQEWAAYLATAGKSQTDPHTRQTTHAPLAETTVSLKLAALASLYDFVQRRYTFTTPDGRQISLWPADRANPFTTVERPHISPYGRAKYPTTAELAAILSRINTNCLTGKRDFALIFTISITCRRCSEIVNLRKGDLRELDSGDYSFTYRYKGGDLRRAVLPRLAYHAITAYLAAADRPWNQLDDDAYLFTALRPEQIHRLRPDLILDPNRPITNHTANAILKKYARRCGVEPAKAHIHGLRHAGARLRVEQMTERRGGPDYMELMQLLGHSSLAVTQIYSQTLLEDPKDPGGRAAAEALLPKGPRPRRRPVPVQEKLL